MCMPWAYIGLCLNVMLSDVHALGIYRPLSQCVILSDVHAPVKSIPITIKGGVSCNLTLVTGTISGALYGFLKCFLLITQ